MKHHEYLICIDSDGCAIDSMDIKHIRCFGPCMVEEWNLVANEEEILKRWNQINLYSMTRGINRYKGLAAALKEINDQYAPIEGIETLLLWAAESDELSNAALQKEINNREETLTDHTCLEKALHWSNAVNEAIANLPQELVKPYGHVKETIELLHQTCDIAIVSSANYEAVKEEWTRFGLLESVDVLMAQNAGSKQSCIAKLLANGYQKQNVLMVGDAPGDRDAAKVNEVSYYPILTGREEESWAQLEEAVQRLKTGTYQGGYQSEVERAFINNLTR